MNGTQLGLFVICGALHAVPVFAASTERVSVSSAEREAGANSSFSVMTPDGRFVAFSSEASNLVPNDTNGMADIFVRDRQAGTTQRVSVTSAEVQADNVSTTPSISADGRFVAFSSSATNLVVGDTNGAFEVFVRDRQTGTTERVSVATGGGQASLTSESPSISSDGRFVAFMSHATDLVGGDLNGQQDIFVHDRLMGTTKLISVSSDETQADQGSFAPVISGNGRFVAFLSLANNLIVPSDTNGQNDVFMRDRIGGTTEKISVSFTGGEANATARFETGTISITGDGRLVAFASYASDLVPDDDNGHSDVFVRDRESDTTQRISIGIGAEPTSESFQTSMSATGRFVAFQSRARNLVEGDTNQHLDTFVHDRLIGTTQRVSVSDPGSQSSHDVATSTAPSISNDGRFVSFESPAFLLVPDDTNDSDDVFVRDRGLLAESRNELLADLGSTGLWQRSDRGRWTKIDAASPIAIAAGDLDSNFMEEVIASFPGRGLEARHNNAGPWQQLHATAPDRFVAADFDGNGTADLAGDFGAAGLLVRNNNGAWTRRAAASQGLAVGDLDGNGKDELIADRGATGLWARYNNTNQWTQLHTVSPVHVAVGDFDDDGKDDLAADLGAGQGIFVRTKDADPWRNVIASASEGLATGDLDDDGRDDLIADFSNGLRVRYNNVNPWFTLDTRSPSNILSLDLDRNGMDDVIAGFPDAGVSARFNGLGAWQILRPVLEQAFAEGSLH